MSSQGFFQYIQCFICSIHYYTIIFVSFSLSLSYFVVSYQTINDSANFQSEWLLTATVFCAITAWVNVQGSEPGYLVSISSSNRNHNDNNQNTTTSKSESDDKCCLAWKYKRYDNYGFHDAESPLLSADKNESSNSCQYCKAIILPRSHHCRKCNKCVASFDHHCQVLDTCIGERNRPRFYLFLLVEIVCCIIAFIMIGNCFDTHIHYGYIEYIRYNLMVLFLRFMLGGWIFNMSMLFCFHTGLILFNYTTYEILSSTTNRDFSSQGSEYSEGWISNCIKFFCCYSSNCRWNRQYMNIITLCWNDEIWYPIQWTIIDNRKNDSCNNDIYECC